MSLARERQDNARQLWLCVVLGLLFLRLFQQQRHRLLTHRVEVERIPRLPEAQLWQRAGRKLRHSDYMPGT